MSIKSVQGLIIWVLSVSVIALATMTGCKKRVQYPCEIDAAYMSSAYNKISHRDKIKLAMGQEIFLQGTQGLGVHEYDFQIDPSTQSVLLRDRNSPNLEFQTVINFQGAYINYLRLNKQFLVYDQVSSVVRRQPRFDYLNSSIDFCRERVTNREIPIDRFLLEQGNRFVNAHRYTSVENTQGFIEMIIDVDYPNTPDRPRAGNYLAESPVRFVSGGIWGEYQEAPWTQFYFSSVGLEFPLSVEILNSEDTSVGSHGIFSKQRQKYGSWIVAYDDFNSGYYTRGSIETPASGIVSWEMTSTSQGPTGQRWEFFAY
jgi:hypothetical protein